MPTATEMLAELHDRLGQLPQQIAETISRLRPATPPEADNVLPTVQQAVNNIGLSGPPGGPQEAPGPPSTFGSPEPPGMPPESSGPPGTSWQPPQPPMSPGQFGGVSSAPSDDADGGGMPFTAPEAATGSLQPPQGAAGGDVIDLLTQIHAALSSGRQQPQEVSGRQPPPPARIPAVAGSPSQVTEGYAGGASPSLDVSNIAGAGGASSRRGFGTNSVNSRYWQPEDLAGGVPR